MQQTSVYIIITASIGITVIIIIVIIFFSLLPYLSSPSSRSLS